LDTRVRVLSFTHHGACHFAALVFKAHFPWDPTLTLFHVCIDITMFL
jgi:hypothetical protein